MYIYLQRVIEFVKEFKVSESIRGIGGGGGG